MSTTTTPIDIQARFSGIREVIAGEIDQVQRSIIAAVAWMTEPILCGGSGGQRVGSAVLRRIFHAG